MRRALCTLLCVAMTLPSGAEAGKLYGLVIGIDDYQFIPDLHGARNDAADIADALTGLGAQVETLMDGQATRTAILGAWRRLATGLAPGDKLIVSYAGHGSNEPEAVKGNEADGRDETLLLSGFAPYGKAAGERIRDDEIAELLALNTSSETIFLADACHSGTLSRNVDPVLGYRYVAVDGITEDPLPPPPPRPASTPEQDQATLFLGAADDSEKTPEFLIDGKPRGALSYAFAAGLRGAADANRDSQLTKGEIEGYVRRRIRGVSQGTQRPQIAPAGGADRVVLALPTSPTPEMPPGTLLDTDFADLPPVTLSHNGGAAGDRLLAPVRGIRIVAPGTPADLRLDMSGGVIRSMVGDVIRDVGTAPPPTLRAAIEEVADKTRVVTALGRLQNPLEVTFAEGDKTYRGGEVVRAQLAGRNGRSLVLVNIASDGKIAFLYPRRELGDPTTRDPADALLLPLQVGAPFGADHVLAIDSSAPLEPLIAFLGHIDGSRDMATFWDGLSALLSQTEPTPQIALFPFHSVKG